MCVRCVKCVSSVCQVCVKFVNSESSVCQWLKCVSSGVKSVSSVCQGNGWEDERLGGQSPGGIDGQTDKAADERTDECVHVFVKCGSSVCHFVSSVCQLYVTYVKCRSSVLSGCQV